MAAPEHPKNLPLLLRRAANPQDLPEVNLNLQVLYHPEGIKVPPKIFANGLEQQVYADVLGRNMFLPTLDKARAALPLIAPITTLVLDESGLYDPASKIIDIRTKMSDRDIVFHEASSLTSAVGDQ